MVEIRWSGCFGHKRNLWKLWFEHMSVKNPHNRANPKRATVFPFREHQCASLLVFQNPRKLWLHGISFSFSKEWMKSMKVLSTMGRKVLLVLVNFCCSLINYIENAFKIWHNYTYNCRSVARVLQGLQPIQPEKDPHTAIVLPEQPLSQGWYSS